MPAQAPSTRWCPTQEQLMILEELYRSGVRTPDAPQIQQITVHLSCYGRIEGKNVFYWFQNHKARERQKLRKRLVAMHHHHHHHHHHLLRSAAAGFNPNCCVFFHGHDQPHLISTNTPPPLPPPPPPPSPFFNQDASTQGLNLLCKLETKGEELTNCSSEAYGFVQQYCTNINPCFNPPKTLDLFPTKSTFGFQSESIDQ